jgi:hypothetical protein
MLKHRNQYTVGNNSITRRKWGRGLRWFGLASLLSLTVTAGQPSAEAKNFTVQSLRGNWGFSGSGTISPPTVPQITWGAVVGILTFDGSGGCSMSNTANIGGTTTAQTSQTCTYTVNPDGTGSIVAQFPGDPGPLPLSFVLVDGGDELHLIRTDIAVATGVAKRQ